MEQPFKKKKKKKDIAMEQRSQTRKPVLVNLIVSFIQIIIIIIIIIIECWFHNHHKFPPVQITWIVPKYANCQVVEGWDTCRYGLIYDISCFKS